MTRNKAARDCCNSHRAKCPLVGDTQIIARDVALGILGALVMVGVPLMMAALKSAGVW